MELWIILIVLAGCVIWMELSDARLENMRKRLTQVEKQCQDVSDALDNTTLDVKTVCRLRKGKEADCHD